MAINEGLQCVDVSKSYGGVHAVRSVSLTVSPGEAVGLVGPNGAGKTTLIDVITGVQRADSGQVLINGSALEGGPSARVTMGLARTFQHPQLGMDLSVRENLLLGLTGTRLNSFWQIAGEFIKGVLKPFNRIDNEKVDKVATLMGIEDLERLAGDLTLGEHRVIEVARAFLSEPDVLLLDEPFAGSDESVQQRIGEVIQQLVTMGNSVVLVDHNVDLVARSVSRMSLLDFGAVVAEGDPQEVLNSAEMSSVYFGRDQDE